MSTNLLSELTNQFGGETLTKIAGALGENSSSVRGALGGVLPALLGGIANKASTSEGASELLDVMKNGGFDRGASSVASAVAGPDGVKGLISAGAPLLSTIFGTKSNALVEWLGAFGGVSKSSASSLLGLALPIVLGQVGKLVSGVGWNASSLMNIMAGQKAFLGDAPSGLSSVLGLAGGAQQVKQAASAYASGAAASSSSWWKWLLPLLALIALGLYFGRGLWSSGSSETATTPTATPQVAVTTAAPAVASVPGLGAFISVALPNGVSLNIPSNGVESKLLGFIKDSSQQVDKATWFSFDRLEFETGSAKLKPSSTEQLTNTAQILKAFPNVNIKLGGYTDNTGNAASNVKLSGDRGANTVAELVKLGVDKSRLASEGYGSEHPVADNATAEGRQRNRRIDIRVTKK